MTPFLSNKYIGIDPGKSGGIMIIDETGKASAYKCPEKVFDMSVLFKISIGDTPPDKVRYGDSGTVDLAYDGDKCKIHNSIGEMLNDTLPYK